MSTQQKKMNRKPVRVFIDGAGMSSMDGKGSGYAWLREDTGEHFVKRCSGLTNNQAEYEAFIAALKALPSKTKAEILSDSQLLVNQFRGLWAVRDVELARLLDHAHKTVRQKGLEVELKWIPRKENRAGRLI